MSKKLQNIDAINRMLQGDHKFQTKSTHAFSTSSKSNNTSRLIGERWEETDPTSGIVYEYEQKNGYVSKQKKGNAALQSVRDMKNTFPNCTKETCTCVNPNHLDFKMKQFHGMCYDCVIDMEHQLKVNGKFNEYAIELMERRAKDWIKTAERDLKVLKDAYTKSYDVIINAQGHTETVDSRMTPDEFSDKVETEFEKYKSEMLDNIERFKSGKL